MSVNSKLNAISVIGQSKAFYIYITATLHSIITLTAKFSKKFLGNLIITTNYLVYGDWQKPFFKHKTKKFSYYAI